MNIAKKLYELQLLDLEIQKTQIETNAINNKLVNNETLVKAQEKHKQSKEQLLKIEKDRKEIEYEVDDLAKTIKQVGQKLYGGTVKNPKELQSLEQEIKGLQDNLKQKEDALLVLMNDEEKAQNDTKVDNSHLTKLESEWEEERKLLEKQKIQMDSNLVNLAQRRQTFISEVDAQSLKLYETIKQRKGQAVARVEQGRCQGCRISLSVNELQKARVGKVIQCSSCGFIIYLS